VADVRVLVACSVGGAGHLNPLRPFIDALLARGDEVLVVVPPSLTPHLTGSGYLVREGAEPPAETVAAVRRGIATAPGPEAAVLSERELFGRLATAAMLPAMEEAFDDWRPQLVVRETCEYAAAVVAVRHRVPCAQVAVSQGRVDASALELAAPALEPYGADLVPQIRRSPYLTRFPASLDPASYPDTRRVAEARPAAAPLPDWWGPTTAPLVYLTLGSIAGSLPIAPEIYRTGLDALGSLDVRVLVTTGHPSDPAGPALLGPVPPNVHVEVWVPQDDVFAAASAVVCHGGSGTTLGALAAGLPLVIVPLFADQFSNGRRVAVAGAGLVVEPAADGSLRPRIGRSDTPRLAAAVTSVLDNPGYRRAATGVACEMAGLPSPAAVLEGLAARGVQGSPGGR